MRSIVLEVALVRFLLDVRVSRSTKYEPPSGSTTRGDAALVRDDLLGPQRERRRLRGRQRERLVERVGVQRVVPPSTADSACSAVRTTLL